MKKAVAFLFIAIPISMLSGCILSKSPSTNDVYMSYNEQKTFSVNVFPLGATYSWSLDSTPLSNTGKSYEYISQGGDHILIVRAKNFLGTDTQAWNILSNSPPVARTGPDQTVIEGMLVTLDASNSTDLDDDIVSYEWEQTSGTPVELSSPNNMTTTFLAPDESHQSEALSFKLTVTDSTALISMATTIVNVTWIDEPPMAIVRPDQTVEEGVPVVLDGSGSTDPDDGIASYEWVQIDGPIVILADADKEQATFISPDVGPSGTSLTFRLTVTDHGGLKSNATCIVNVTWINEPPVADAGPDQTVAEVTVVTLDASNSYDKDGIVSYDWQQTDGPAAILSNASAIKPTFMAPNVIESGAILKFKLTVTDNGGLKSTDTCTVNVIGVNDPPIAEAGPNQSVVQGMVVTLNGGESTDPDNGIILYQWQQTGGPSVTISNASTTTAQFVASVAVGSTLTFELTVTDAGGLTNKDTCMVSVVSITFNNTFGWSTWEEGYAVQQTSDGGYILAGYKSAINDDALLVKADANGDLLWDRIFNKTYSYHYFSHYARAVRQTSDGGYILAGYTDHDAWLIKTDSSGLTCNYHNETGNCYNNDTEWVRVFGLGNGEYAYAVQQTSDGGYITAGYTTAGNYDAWLTKTDSSGNKLWGKTFGGSNNDYTYAIQQTSDGGYILTGYTKSYGAGGQDAWLIKTDSSGNKLWDRTFGGSFDEYASSVQQTSDGGYILAGYTSSYGVGGQDAWLIKTDSNGNKLWDRTFGGSDDEYASSVQQTSDGGYILAGYTSSYGVGGQDAWLIKTDSNGNKLWDRTFGGSDEDYASAVQQTSDGGYILAGATQNSDYMSHWDAWLIKTDAEGNAPAIRTPKGL